MAHSAMIIQQDVLISVIVFMLSKEALAIAYLPNCKIIILVLLLI